MLEFDTLRPRLDRYQRLALVIGAVALIVGIAWGFIDRTQFFQSYLFAFLPWFGLSMGGMAAVMLHHMVGGGWGALIRRINENSAMLIPLMGLLFIPVLIGIPYLYIWSLPAEYTENPIIRAKTLYLNVPFFAGRAIAYFLIWSLMAYFLNRWSNQQDVKHTPALTEKFKQLSAPGLVIYVLTLTFAVFDWGMSLEPEWFSSIYGVIYVVGQALLALSFSVIMLSLLRNYRPLSEAFSVNRLHDVGKLMFAFVVLWTYIGASQLIIIYSGNIAEETPWYIHRSTGGWQYFAIFLVLFQFATPFFLLLSRRTKRTVERLRLVAIGLIVVRFIDLFWLIQPSFHPEGVHFHPLDIILPVGIGGIWIAAYIYMMKRRPIVAINSPILQGTTGNTVGAYVEPHTTSQGG